MSADLPPPSPELVLVRVGIEALVDALGPKRGERFLKAMAARLSQEVAFAEALKLRPASDEAALTRSRREAMVWFRVVSPQFISRLEAIKQHSRK